MLHWELASSRHIIISQTATGTQCEDHTDFEYAEFSLKKGKYKASTFEKLSTFLHWLTTKESNSENVGHYLDDFFFAGKANSNNCQSLMTTFINICKKLQVPIADEKTEGPTCVMEYLGCQIFFVLPSTGFEPTPLLHCSTIRLALRPAP